jgi:hypothetical protein
MGVRNSARRGVGSGSMRRRHLMPVCTAVGLLIAMLPALLPVSSANAATATLTVTSPTQNQILSSGSVTVTGTSTLAGTIKVTFDSQNPAVTASTSGTAPNVTWSATKSLADGTHTAVADLSGGGNSGTSPTRTFKVDTTNPTISITSPTSPATTSDTTPTISGTVGDANLDTVKINGTGPGGATFGPTLATVTGGTSWSVDTPTLSEGSWSITATATDLATPTAHSTTSSAATVVVDTTNPTVAITSPADGSSTSDDTPTISGTVSDLNLQKVEVSGTGPGAATYGPTQATVTGGTTWSLDTTSLVDGSWTFTAKATDKAGNNTTSTAVTITVDAPPNTTIDSGPGSTADGTADFTFSSNDAAATFACKLDGPGATTGSYSACNSGSKSYPGLVDGNYTFSVRATDTSNNTDASPATQAFTVDNTAPTTTIDTGPGITADGTADFTFSSNEAGATFACKLDGPGATTGSYSACNSGSKSYPGLVDGNYTFSVRATDTAGNTDATPATNAFTVVVDSIPPETTIDSGPGSTTDGIADFTFSSNEAGSTFRCELVGPGHAAGFTPCTQGGNPTGTKSYTGLADGSYTFSVRATDLAGNIDASPATQAFTVDTVAPTTTIDTGPGSTTDGIADFTFSSNEAGSTFECKLDGPGIFVTGTYSACTSPKSYPGLADGDYTFSVRATDAAGNTDATPASQAFSLDNTAPITTIDSGPAGATSSTTADFTFSSNESGSTFECKLDGPGTATGTFASCTSPQSYPSLAEGDYTFSVRATDTAGNTDATPDTKTFTVDTTAPDTTIDSGPGATNDRTADYTFSSSEPTDATFECKLDGPGTATGTFTSCTSPQSYSSLADGDYTFSVQATDAAGNTDATPDTDNFTVDGTAPDTSIDSGPGDTTDLSADFTFSSEAGATFECELTGPGHAAGFSTCTSPQSYSSLADGSYTFSVRASDTAGNTDASPATQAFTVDNTPPVTSLDSGPGSTGDAIADFTFSSNEPGGTFECKLDGPGATTGTFTTCTSPKSYPGLANGDYTFSVRAIDAANHTGNTVTTPTFSVLFVTGVCNGRNVTLAGATDGPDTLVGSPDADVIDGKGGNDIIEGLGGNDVICGGTGDDKMYGEDGNDSLIGDAGNDFFTGGYGADRFSGGDGTNDRVSYSDPAHTTSVLVTIGNGKSDDGSYVDGPSTARDEVFSNVEGVIGGPGNDHLIGTDAANSLDGAGGDDTLQGLGGNDTLVGGSSGDFLYGGYGRDSVIGGTGVDALYGEGDGDYLYAQDNTKDARIDGGTGTDKAYRDSIDPAPISVP